MNPKLVDAFLTTQFNLMLASNYYLSPQTELRGLTLDKANEFFEGGFLRDFKLGFLPNGPDLNYTVTSFLTATKDVVVAETARLMSSKPKSYTLPASTQTTAAVMQMLSIIGLNDYYSFYADVDLAVGGLFDSEEPTAAEMAFFADAALSQTQDVLKVALAGNTTVASGSGAAAGTSGAGSGSDTTAAATDKKATRRRLMSDQKRPKHLKV